MEVRVKAGTVGRHRDEALVLLVAKGEDPGSLVRQAGQGFEGGWRTLSGREAFLGGEGQVRVLHDAPTRRIPTLVVGGLGEGSGARGGQRVDGEALRRGAGAALRAAREEGARSVTVVLPRGRGPALRAEAAAQALVEGALLGLYRFEAWRSKPASTRVESLTILAPPRERAAAARGARVGEIQAEATCLARDLGNEPGNRATPTHLAQTAVSIAERDGLLARVIDEDEMGRLGMGALLGVSRGSREPAKLIVLTWEPRRRRGRLPTVALVGKGLTFDTGGISIKPAAKLEDMKFDMCGGAAVIAAMQAAARLEVGVRVVGIVPASENMPGGSALKPGDIVRAMNGTTIEVKNTDAEGRLILADALCYATRHLRPRPRAIVDLATLTGACVVALGDAYAALVSTDDRLARRVEAAAAAAGDPVWRMPLAPVYGKQMESHYADLSNLGTPGAGALTAAAFLERFTDGVPWAHLDIAGVAWTEKERGEVTRGATGFGVRLLSTLLRRWGDGADRLSG